MTLMQFETDVAEVDYEDSGQAAIVHILPVDDPDSDEGPFVRVQSWSERCQHPFIDSLVGRRVRVTVEVLP